VAEKSGEKNSRSYRANSIGRHQEICCTPERVIYADELARYGRIPFLRDENYGLILSKEGCYEITSGLRTPDV